MIWNQLSYLNVWRILKEIWKLIILKTNNKEYRDLFTKIERFKNKYPNIRGILEDERITEMTLEESKGLVETINLYRDLLKIEQYEMFLFGGREMYNYFKSVGIID